MTDEEKPDPPTEAEVKKANRVLCKTAGVLATAVVERNEVINRAEELKHQLNRMANVAKEKNDALRDVYNKNEELKKKKAEYAERIKKSNSHDERRRLKLEFNELVNAFKIEWNKAEKESRRAVEEKEKKKKEYRDAFAEYNEANAKKKGAERDYKRAQRDVLNLVFRLKDDQSVLRNSLLESMRQSLDNVIASDIPSDELRRSASGVLVESNAPSIPPTDFSAFFPVFSLPSYLSVPSVPSTPPAPKAV